MKVIIFGATGGIGKQAVKHAKEHGYEVTVYVRDKSKVSDKDIKIMEGELSDYPHMKAALEGQDAVIWCVGIPMKKNYGEMASLEGHRNLIKAMEETGVKRLVYWGTPSIHFNADKKSFITVVPGIMAGLFLSRAKQEMVEIGNLLESSRLDWTMVRFMAPKDSAYTGKVKVGFGDTKMSMSISREDIGAFMVEQVEDTKFIHSMPIIGS